jgi:hypothetical protein
MESIGHMIMNDESPDAIRDAIINTLYTKAAERVEYAKPYVAANIFDEDEEDEDYEDDDDDEDYEDDDEDEE